MVSWFLIGILVGLCIRCIVRPHKNELEKFKDPWNWTSFGGGG
tara:strand:- start:445 stop:573 length:129 start_codon:yes stop_codon:yes gene_type:complete